METSERQQRPLSLFERAPWLAGFIKQRVAANLRISSSLFENGDLESEITLSVLRVSEKLELLDETELRKLVTVIAKRKVAEVVRAHLRERKRCEPLGENDAQIGFVELSEREFFEFRKRLNVAWTKLTPRLRGLVYLRMSPPADLWVLNRNVSRRSHGGICNKALAIYTGLTEDQVTKYLSMALAVMREQFER